MEKIMEKLYKGLFVGIVLAAIPASIYFGVFYKAPERITTCGEFEYHHKLEDGTPVFKLGTQRGTIELVRGRENLQNSLNTYRENGSYGKSLKELD